MDKIKETFRGNTKYYFLEVFYGARKQVFFTFGPYVLALFYGANAATISLLFALSAVACFFYGFAHYLFPRDVAFVVCCINYILDAVISLASMASNVYVQDLSDHADEVKATISTGVSVNHSSSPSSGDGSGRRLESRLCSPCPRYLVCATALTRRRSKRKNFQASKKSLKP